MADFAGGGEIVARGAEGTGAATILNNNPTLQSLARTTARLDNLFKLKLIAATPKKAKEEPPVSIDLKGVTAGPWQNALVETNQIDKDAALNKWGNLDRTGQRFLASDLQAGEATANNFNTGVIPQIEAATKRANELGYNLKPEEIKLATDAKLNEIDNGIKEYALKNNITDPIQLNKMRRNAIMQSDLPGFYYNFVQTPQNLNLNVFGDRLLKNIADKTIEVPKKGGGTITVSKGQILKQNTSGIPEIDPEMGEALIYSNDDDARMYEQGIQKVLPLVVNSLNDPKAKQIYEQVKADPSLVDKLPAQDRKYFEEKVLIPTRQNVMEKMWGGKSKISITREEAAKSGGGDGNGGNKLNASYTSTDKIQPHNYLLDINGKPIIDSATKGQKTFLQPDIQLGANTTVNGNYNIPSGSKVWFLKPIPQEVADALGWVKNTSDGSYTLRNSVEANSMTKYKNSAFLTSKPQEILTEDKTKGFMPIGTLTKSNNANSRKVESPAIFNLKDLMDRLPTALKEKLQRENTNVFDARVMVDINSGGFKSALATFKAPDTKATNQTLGDQNATLEFLNKK
jgi:hypothetical protein